MVGVMNAKQSLKVVYENTGGYPAMTMPDFLNDVVLPNLPRFFRAMMERIRVRSSAGGTSAQIVTVDAYLTIESQAELGQNATEVPYRDEIAAGADEVTFGCYTGLASRIKRAYNGNGEASNYWLRSPYHADGKMFCCVEKDGNMKMTYPATTVGVSWGFCLRANGGA